MQRAKVGNLMIKRLSFVFLIALVLAACSAAATPTPVPTTAPTQQSAAVQATQQANAYNSPDWTKIALTDSHTGKTFTLADFAGKTVYIEPMATWCTNCRAQLPNVEAARVKLNSDQYVFIGLSVAEQVDNKTLADYVDKYGWHWTFAVAPDALTKALVDQFGGAIVTPPSTPHIIISPDGTVSPITTGFHSPDELITAIKAASQS
jgi:hypothetical protein